MTVIRSIHQAPLELLDDTYESTRIARIYRRLKDRHTTGGAISLTPWPRALAAKKCTTRIMQEFKHHHKTP